MQKIEYISLVFITQSYFVVPKEFRLYSTHYLIMKIHKKGELKSVAINHSGDTDYNFFLDIYRKGTSESYLFFTIATTLPADDPLCFRKKISRFIIKTALTDEIKVLDHTNKSSQAQ